MTKTVERLLTEHMDTWTAAVETKSAAGRGSSKKLKLVGIAKLRELILELAVRGQLVPQDESDEPASVLLERISAESERLVKEKKIKKPKKLPEISEDEKPFDLPGSWEWLRLPDTYYTISPSGKKLKSSDVIDEGRYPVVDQGLSYVSGYTNFEELVIKIPNPVIIFGDHTTNRKYIDFDFVAGADGTKILSPICLNEQYFYKALLSLKLEGRGYARHFKVLNTHLISIPPLAEQYRIVAKVDELMSLCDALEQEQESSIAAHSLLVENLLAALTNAAGQGEFKQAWARVAEHFDTLFTTEQSVEQLKQTILQLAVMGMLVEQDPADEPAGVLLERIAAEKARLVEEKVIKKQKPSITFEGLDQLKKIIPASWAWVRLSDIADIVRGGSPRPAGDLRFYDGTIPFLKVGDVTRKSGKYVEGFNATIKEAGLVKTRFVEGRTVLLSNSGATLGIPAICDFSTTFNDGIAAFIEKSDFVCDEYLYLYLNSISKWFLDVASRGQGQPNLNTDIIKSTWFPLPPLTEQHRIVARTDKINDICDLMKVYIRNDQMTVLDMAKTLTKQAIA